ncbi:nucleotide disphospho-sugar-binding domain-containing protein [Kitasatospora sp. NPDC049285]|uniref:nucleotide disphospho-sugar-binding domain-containing protein n=1 Tax=Kitasatospora sp. NPDC049285 TaxID=3157096 RepID=UPI00341CC497
MSKIIVAATPVTGHTHPLLRIATHLAEQGHEVAFLGGARYRAAAEECGLAFAPLPAEADYDDRDFAASFPERAAVPAGPAQLLWDVMHVFGDPLPAQHRALRALLAEFPAVAVLHDSLFLGAVALAMAHPRAERPAVLAVGISPLALVSKDTAPPLLGLLPPVDEQQRAEYAALGRESARRMRPAMEYVNARFAETGLQVPEGTHLFGRVESVDALLQLTVPAFEYPRSDLPANVAFVGPLPIPAAPGGLRPDWWPRLAEAREAGRRVVVVTQGTIANADPQALLAPAVRALADRQDLLVIVATGRVDGPDLLRGALPAVPANTVLAGFVPFDALLPHADALVTNGGYGGVQAALGHAVPVVVAGDSEDKPEVAARVEWTGTGVNLRTGRPTERQLATAVDTVLTDPELRDRAAALAKEFAGYDALRRITELLPRVAAPRR